jgi:hypothetical protein
VVLVALLLVNLPFVHDSLTDRRIDRSGVDVEARIVRAQSLDGRHLVGYRLPRSIDPTGTVFTARLDAATYDRARATRVLAVRVLVDRPAANRPEGEVASPLFGVVALSCDLLALCVGLFLWRRWRRRSLHEVVSVEDGEVTLSSLGRTLRVVVPPAWGARVQPGDRVSGALRLVAEEDVRPGIPLSGLEQVRGSSYVVRGRVVDARSDRVVVELADRSRLVVEMGGHRIRADIRDSTEVRGVLHFTPTISRE